MGILTRLGHKLSARPIHAVLTERAIGNALDDALGGGKGHAEPLAGPVLATIGAVLAYRAGCHYLIAPVSEHRRVVRRYHATEDHLRCLGCMRAALEMSFIPASWRPLIVLPTKVSSVEGWCIQRG